MSEIKGQLLTMLLVMIAFAAVGSILYGSIKSSSTMITEKLADEVSFVENPKA